MKKLKYQKCSVHVEDIDPNLHVECWVKCSKCKTMNTNVTAEIKGPLTSKDLVKAFSQKTCRNCGESLHKSSLKVNSSHNKTRSIQMKNFSKDDIEAIGEDSFGEPYYILSYSL